MKAGEKVSLVIVFALGIIMALVCYFLYFVDDTGESKDLLVMNEEAANQEASGKEDDEKVIISDIDGDFGLSEDQALPESEDKEIGSLVGKVLDSEKKPLAEAYVAIFRSKNPGLITFNRKLKALYKTKTDEKGFFKFDPLYPGAGYRVMADHDLFMRTTITDISVKEGNETELPAIVLTQGKTAYGKVRDPKNEPIHGAVIAIYDPLNSLIDLENFIPERIVKTNEKGEYSLTFLEDSNFIIQATAPGYERKSIRNQELFTEKERLEFNFTLAKELTIKGAVYDEHMQPIADAVLHALSQDQKHRQNFTGVTNDEGEFTIRGLSKGHYYISATHEFYSTEAGNKIKAGREDVYYKLERRSGLAGKVVDANNNPVQSFWVSAKRQGPATDAWCTEKVKKRFRHKEGRFVMDGLDPGKYEVEVLASGFALFRSETIKVEKKGPTTDLVFQLNRGGSVSGYVLNPDGRPLRRALVSLRRNKYSPNPMENFFGVASDSRMKSTRTNADGYFIMEKIMAGTYQVEVSHGKYPSERVNEVVIEMDTNTEVANLQMKVGGTLKGRVYNDANTPLSGVKVTLRKQDNSFQHSTTTDSEGYYKFSDIPPGLYNVGPMPKIEPNKNPLAGLPSVLKSEVKGVEIREGEVKELPLIIYS